MPITLYINPDTYDIESVNGQLRFTQNYTEWLSIKLEARLSTFFAEWFVNRTIGLPYFSQIFGKQTDINNVQVLLGNYIKATRGVKELLTFTVDFDAGTRDYKYNFSVLSEEGTIIKGGNR